MRILVTGASGFAGAFVARELAQARFDVVGVYRRETPFLALVKQAPIRVVRFDLENAAALPGPFDVVVHAAATSPMPGVTAARMVRDNVNATLALIQAAENWRSRAFVFFSSVSRYGKITAPVLDERTPIIDPDIYGATKYLGECMLAERSDTLPGLALRLPAVLGPGAHRSWLPGVVARLRAAQPIEAYNLNAPFNNATHVKDVASLIINALRSDWRGFDAIVVGASGTLAVREVIETLAREIDVPARIIERPPTKAPFILSSQRAIERWGYKPMAIGDLLKRYSGEIFETADHPRVGPFGRPD
jgi:nucleoside-diphosphate-sugar epimerase